MLLALDTETALITDAQPAPPLVCLQIANEDKVSVIHHSEALHFAEGILRDDAIHIVGHEIAFDMAVLAHEYPQLMPLIFRAYENDRIQDTALNAKLSDIEHGCYPRGYGLDDVAARYLKREVDKSNPWRLRFVELRDYPVAFWPKEAVDYAREDARATYDVWRVQQRQGLSPDRFRQARAGWWLRLTSNRGLMTDTEAVSRFAHKLRASVNNTGAQLLKEGLLRKEKKGLVRDTKAAKQRMRDTWGGELPLTPTGDVSLSGEFLEASGDELLLAYAEYSSSLKKLRTDVPLLRKGAVHRIHTHYEVLQETGRTGSSKPNVQNFDRRSGIRECFVPASGYVFACADYGKGELCTWAQICLWLFGQSRMAEVLNAGGDPHVSVAKTIAGDAWTDDHRQVGKVCFHPDTEVLTRRGWVKFPDLVQGEQIAVPKVSDDSLRVGMKWEEPLAITSRRAPELVHLENESLDLLVTPDHRMAGWKQIRYRDGRVRLKRETLPATETSSFRYVPHAAPILEGKKVSRRLMRIVAAVQADGSYVSADCIRFGFSKERKVKRLRWLLRGEEYTEKYFPDRNPKPVWEIRLHGPLVKQLQQLMPEKQLTWGFLQFDYVSRLALVRETRFWDGHRYRKGWNYCSVPQKNREVLSALATTVGYKSSISGYNVSIKPRSYSRGGNVVVQKQLYDGPVYCVKTSTDFVLVRHNSKAVITHQCNFGLPGGMGVKRLVDYAWKSYDVRLELSQATFLREMWRNSWPEARMYHNYISELFAFDDKIAVRQFVSDRMRGGCGYTQACNTLFQGLLADAAKHAGFYIAKACLVDTNSPLYGSHIVNFPHDEFIVEVPEAQGHWAALELARLMHEKAADFIPNVTPVAEPLLSTRWSKNAKPKRDESGLLIPWH